MRYHTSQERSEPPFVEAGSDVPLFGVAGLGDAEVGDPIRQLGGEVVAGRDRDDVVLFPVEEQDRELEVLGTVDRVEALPVGVDAGADRPFDRLGEE